MDQHIGFVTNKISHPTDYRMWFFRKNAYIDFYTTAQKKGCNIQVSSMRM